MIAANRWQTPGRTLQWTRSMEAAGWQTDLARSYMLKVSDRQGGRELLPLTVHIPNETPPLSVPDDILALHTYVSLRDPKKWTFEGPMAEALRRSLGSSLRVVGFEVHYFNGSGVERAEVLTSGPLVAYYRSTSRGYRHGGSRRRRPGRRPRGGRQRHGDLEARRRLHLQP